MNSEAAGMISLIGTQVQLAATLLLFVLFLFVGRHAGQRQYFSSWTWAWLALALAIIVIGVGYYFFPGASPDTPNGQLGPGVRAIHLVYQVCKLMFLVLMLIGTLQVGRSRDQRRLFLWLTLAGVGYALLSVALSADLGQIVAWQAFAAAPVLGFCGYRLLALAKGWHRTLGVHLTAVFFAASAILWLLYFLAFAGVQIRGQGIFSNPFSLLDINNSFIDAILQMLLGVGMIVMLVEGTVDDADQARAELQARLAQAQRMEAVGQVVSGVAHELNNPLATILTFSEILLRESRPDDDAAALGTIRDQARRCRTVVRNLLRFVREVPLRREPVLLREILDRVSRTFEPEFAQLGINLRMEVPATLPLLEADAEAIEQVFTNVISNAIYGIAKFGTIDIRAVDAGDRLIVDVEDSGAGVPLDILPRVFDPFFSGKASGKGTGLGLSVAQGIVEQHGGSIRLENRPAPERGARVVVEIPMKVRAPGQRTSAPVPRPSDPPPGAAAPGHRALVIDDETALRSAIRRYLSHLGWQVEEAGEGEAGYRKLVEAGAGGGYDLVICDLKMPGMSGVELHRRLEESRPELLDRLIFVTGDVVSAEAGAFASRAGVVILAKPFELETLGTLVDRVIQRRRT